MVLIVEARKIQASIYTTPLGEIFNKDQVTGDDKELNYTTDTNKVLREIVLLSALYIKKTFFCTMY